MKKRLTPYKSLIIVFLFGLIWIHIDSLYAIAVATLIITLPILGLTILTYLTILILGFIQQKDGLKQKGFIGLISIMIFLIASVLSIQIVDRIYKMEAGKWINELEEYKDFNEDYPIDLQVFDRENIFGLIYSPNTENDSYSITFTNGGLITTKYWSLEKRWKDYGWNE